jgi:amino acid adenylation domain-containing protein
MPFDLARDLMLRICLIRLGEEDSVALFTMHHIASDGWSLGVLAGEVAALYTAFNKRKPSPLPELPLQYADFAHWQRNWLQGDVLNGQLSYWKRQLEGLPLLELPTDRPRPAVQSNRGRGEYITLSKAASQSLRDLSQRKEVTLFMTLLAGFKALLYRYTNQQDIIVGIPIANRNRGEVEGLIGFFVNTLVLRTRLSDEMSFSHLLDSVKEVALGAYAHQDIPFEKLVEELHPDRDLSRTPLFQVSFSLQNNGQGTLDLPGLTISGFGGGGLKALHDMTLDMFEDGGELRGLLVYNQDLFNAETMRRFTRSFETLFEAAAGSPDTPLSLLPLLTETERRQVLIEWNSLYSDYENRNCVHHLFELQAEQNPDSLAVFYEGEQISYAELNRRANHLAHYLRSAGVRPEVRVGILMDTSIDLIISILGILKAGGAYVPLDPTYPRERIEAIIDDIAAPLILTQSRVADLLGLSDIPLLRIDSEWDRVSQHDPGNPQHDLSADNLAYVIYTSGTTGKPKGVMIRHAGVCNRLLWAKSARPYHFSREDRLLHLASFSFDISVWEIFTPLCAGGALIMASSDNRYNIDYLINLISSQGVSFVNFAPSLLKTILEERGLEECNTLKTVLVGSEAVPRELPALFAERAGAALYNFYGPTEATIDATYQDFARERSTGEVAIGRPIGKTQVYILDPRMEPVPVGLSGEIYIGGEGLARGYHNRPDQTAERFIPDPFSSEAGSRLYRTGDLGRYCSDGRIEFRGRADRQVKIRGYRIELEDIEAALREHPGVRDSIVIVAEKVRSTSDAGRLAEAMALADEEGLASLLKTFDESAVIEILQGVESLTDEEATSALAQAD